MTDVEDAQSAPGSEFEPTQEGLELNKPAEDSGDVEAERLHRKQRLACGLRTLGRLVQQATLLIS